MILDYSAVVYPVGGKGVLIPSIASEAAHYTATNQETYSFKIELSDDNIFDASPVVFYKETTDRHTVLHTNTTAIEITNIYVEGIPYYYEVISQADYSLQDLVSLLCVEDIVEVAGRFYTNTEAYYDTPEQGLNTGYRSIYTESVYSVLDKDILFLENIIKIIIPLTNVTHRFKDYVFTPTSLNRQSVLFPSFYITELESGSIVKFVDSDVSYVKLLTSKVPHYQVIGSGCSTLLNRCYSTTKVKNRISSHIVNLYDSVSYFKLSEGSIKNATALEYDFKISKHFKKELARVVKNPVKIAIDYKLQDYYDYYDKNMMYPEFINLRKRTMRIGTMHYINSVYTQVTDLLAVPEDDKIAPEVVVGFDIPDKNLEIKQPSKTTVVEDVTYLATGLDGYWTWGDYTGTAYDSGVYVDLENTTVAEPVDPGVCVPKDSEWSYWIAREDFADNWEDVAVIFDGYHLRYSSLVQSGFDGLTLESLVATLKNFRTPYEQQTDSFGYTLYPEFEEGIEGFRFKYTAPPYINENKYIQKATDKNVEYGNVQDHESWNVVYSTQTVAEINNLTLSDNTLDLRFVFKQPAELLPSGQIAPAYDEILDYTVTYNGIDVVSSIVESINATSLRIEARIKDNGSTQYLMFKEINGRYRPIYLYTLSAPNSDDHAFFDSVMVGQSLSPHQGVSSVDEYTLIKTYETVQIHKFFAETPTVEHCGVPTYGGGDNE